MLRNSLAGGVVFAVAVAVASAAYGGEINWTGNAADNVINTSGNWKGGTAPGQTDAARFDGCGTLALTANDDFLAGYGIFQYCDLTLALGSHAWYGNAPTTQYGYRFQLRNAGKVTLTSGVISNMTHLGVGFGNTYYNTKFTITGSTSKWYGYADDLRIGDSGTNNVVEVLDGAYFRAGRSVRMGFSSAGASNNLLRVSGAGTYFDARPDGNGSMLPNYGCHNDVIIENGATFVSSGAGTTDIGLQTSAHDNSFTVRNGASVTLKRTTIGGVTNTMTVSNASLKTQEFIVGVDASAVGNRLQVEDGAQVTVSHHLRIGYNGARSNVVEIVGAGTAYTNNTYETTVGAAAHCNILRVADGASFAQTVRGFYIGGGLNTDGDKTATSEGNLALFEGEGTTAYVKGTPEKPLCVGYSGTNNTMIVRDGAAFSTGCATYIGNQPTAASNTLEIAGEGTRFASGGNMLFNAVGGRMIARDKAFVTPYKLFVGNTSAARDNVLEISSGAVVSNIFALIVGNTAPSADDPTSVRNNGVIVSNATFYSSMQNDTCFINNYGLGGYMRIVDGGQFINNQNIRISYDDAAAAYGRVDVIGTNSLARALQFDVIVGGRGHHNTLNVENGAKLVCNRSIGIGGRGDGTVSAIASASNNTLRVCNGYVGGLGGTRPTVYCHGAGGRIVWEGAHASSDISTLYMTAGSALECRFDKDGIAPFGPYWETYLIDADHKPLVEKITIDATEFVENAKNKSGSFTILKSDDNRQCRVAGGKDLPAEDFEAINAAIAERIECVPSGFVKVTKIDMEHSRIEVKVKKQGLMILFR